MAVIRERTEQDNIWILKCLSNRWGGTAVVVHGESFDLFTLPAFVAEREAGVITYRVEGTQAELISIDAVHPGCGVGTALLEALIASLPKWQVKSLWVTTTNENLEALRFYQCRGFELRALRPGAVEDARRVKPTIPLKGDNGIPIRDELDLCFDLI